MAAYFNEHDHEKAEALRVLMREGWIADGVVDERDIRDVVPSELSGFAQCHFFAGIGLWSVAARRAGIPDDFRFWSGSCPCQPFSTAGAGNGAADDRHLWPHWYWLIAQCEPDAVVGEQVASKDGLGWLDLVSADMEGSLYAGGALDLCSAGFGAPNIRQRLYMLWLADPDGCGQSGPWGMGQPGDPETGGDRQEHRIIDDGWSSGARLVRDPVRGPTNGFWSGAEWLLCRDPDGPKLRPVEPGTFCLAPGYPARNGELRAYGDAVNLEVATAFLQAVWPEMRSAAA